MRRSALLVLILLLCAGCAQVRAGKPRAQLALGDPPLCKHCNCYMPVGADPTATCTVCNCGYRNAECIRGSLK